MESKMKKILVLLSLLATCGLHAAGTVDFLEVDNDVVLFSTTEAKVATSPACVDSENANMWTVSLASDSGRAIYSLILTAMAKGEGLGLNIESAQDCAVSNGVERAGRVNIVSSQLTSNITSNNDSYSIGVYQGDGITRLGTLIDIDENSKIWTYIDTEVTRSVKSVSFELPPRRIFYYSEENCQGSIFNNSSNVQSGGEGGLYLPEGTLVGNRIYRSRWHSSLDYCDSYNSDKVHGNGTHILMPYTDPICGIDVCVLKQD
jgi:hypothetical protein